MAKILRLDEINYDLWITYSWSNKNHGICGHTFEVIDYYFFLKDYFRVGVLLAEDIDWNVFSKSVTEKYNVTEKELEELKSNTVFCNRPTLVKGNNILFTDGGVASLEQVTLLFKNIFMFACGNLEIKDNKKENVFILQDERIYEKCFNGIHYVKKILFKKYKKIKETQNEDFLLYGTNNCRNISAEMFNDLLGQYPNHFICLTNIENRPEEALPRMQFPDMPVTDLFEKFGTYVYTPVPRKFDCSPRFLAECKFYNKRVIFYQIDYWQEDKGLYWRNWDIENDFKSIFLEAGDAIIEIMREKLELQ